MKGEEAIEQKLYEDLNQLVHIFTNKIVKLLLFVANMFDVLSLIGPRGL